MYIAVSTDGEMRHISFVPHVPGLEALCGDTVSETHLASLRQVLGHTSCGSCRRQALARLGWRPGLRPAVLEAAARV